MANADFSREQNQTPGGFDSGSYREAKRPDTEAVRLTPLQQKLAGLEKALPAALAKQGTALVLSVVVMLAAFAGFGSAKVRSKYNTARQWFTVGVSADNGYNLSEELTARANTAANVITTAGNTLGADNAEVQTAQAALDDFSACLDAVQSGGKSQALTSLSYYNGSSMHALYQANETLGKAIDQLYANGAAAVVMFNRFYQPDIDIEKMAQSAGSVFSTDADLSKSLRWIGIASAAVSKLDYAASGGIHAPEGVVKAILAGASAVEICSALYQNSYAIIEEYVRFLNAWMERKGMENISQFKGMLNVSDLNGINTFERTQFLKYFSARK